MKIAARSGDSPDVGETTLAVPDVQPELDIDAVMRRRLTITGSTLRPRSVEEKGQIASALRREVWPLLESGQVKPLIYRRLPLRDAAEAHRLMESSEHIGKIVLVI